tara:strand:+ start:53 stop:268 length:216 start_codon:yes stop_codon:yes gene_type:complete
MASLKDRFKSGLRAVGAVMTGGVGAAEVGDKKKRLHEGMMKAAGQSKESAASVKRRTDIAAQRISAKKRGK